MEENTTNQAETPTSPTVSFPSVPSPKKGSPKTFLILGILVLVGILGFVIYKSATKNSQTASAEPTPYDNLTQSLNQGVSVSTPTPAPSATPKSVARTGVKIQIQNGTGITGEAAYLETQLKKLGYSDIKVGNAGDQNLTTTEVTFSKTLSSDVVSELTSQLNSLYQNVTVTTSSTQAFDVVIVTGLKKGATPKPSASPSPTATPTT